MKKTTRRHAPQLRTAVRSDARRIHDLIQRNQQAGHLLPRQLSELTSRIDRFVVGVDGRGSIIACGELAPLSSSLAEIRSLVVSEKRRGRGPRPPHRRRAASPRAQRRATTICVCSPISRRISRTWAFRLFRTPGCRRKSRPTAGAARSSGGANNSRW